MKRFSAHIYIKSEDDLSLTSEIAQGLGLVVNKVQGSKAEILVDAATWAVPPQILIIDLSDSSDIPADLAEIAHAGPEGDINVIVIGTQDNVRLARHLRQIGVSDYLLAPLDRDDLVSALQSAIRSGESSALTVEPRKLVSVTSAEGGVGASIIAAALAQHATKTKKRVLLVDLDFVSGDQYIHHGGEVTKGFRNAIQEPARIDNVSLSRLINRVESNPNLFYLSEPGSLKAYPDASGINLFLSQLTASFDFVVLDIPRHAEWARPAFTLSSGVFFVTRPSVSGIRQMTLFRDENERNLISDALHVILNDSNGAKGEGIGEDEFMSRVQCPVLKISHDPVGFYRQMVESGVQFESGKLKKEFSVLFSAMDKLGSKDETVKVRKKKGLVGGFIDWLNT